jgi:hypothetical protein
VSAPLQLAASNPPTAETVRRHLEHARAGARALALDFAADAAALAARGAELADLGDVVPIGVQELGRRMAGTLMVQAGAIENMIDKAGGR